jgi:hypothetical protein
LPQDITDGAGPDVIIVGAGAAGLATSIFLKRGNPSLVVRLVEGAQRPGAKILVSGGTRCNVTNSVVSERDFCGGRSSVVRQVLRGFTADDTVKLFHDLGVPLHEEAGGKLFPDSGRARDVLNALLGGVASTGGELVCGCRVTGVERDSGGFHLITSRGSMRSRFLVLATGGRSLPKSGSDGAGLAFATALGHTLVPQTPALVPLLLDPSSDSAINRPLSGVSHDAEIAIWVDGRVSARVTGSLLWTHFGISGPVVLDASRHWLRAESEGRAVRATLSFRPGERLVAEDARWTSLCSTRPRLSVLAALSGLVPASVAGTLLAHLHVDPTRRLSQLTRVERRSIVGALTEWPLPVTGSRGYTFAEATAGGVPLDEVEPRTLESRVCRGLYLVGEVLDVDGRVGGFNFQWAWSTAFVAARALAARA